jgi:uncharacterized membrane protein YkoI
MRTRFAGSLVVALALMLAGTAEAQEKKIKRSELPPAVEKAVAGLSQGATIKGFSQEIEKGRTYYEVEMAVNGHGKDVLLDPTGAVVEVEEEVGLESLPAAVQAGLKTKAGKGKIVGVESVTKHDKLVAYEAKIVTDGKRSEIQVGPTGK